MWFLSVDAYPRAISEQDSQSSKQFEALQDKLNVQQFVVTDEMGVPRE